MDLFGKGLVTVLAVSGISIAIALPLAFRKVPRNVVYGYRTRRSLSSDSLWYESNARFGRWLIATSAVAALLVLLLSTTSSFTPAAFLKTTIAAMVLPVLVSAVVTAILSRRSSP